MTMTERKMPPAAIHFAYTRWARAFACGLARSAAPVGAAHVTFSRLRITCQACLRVVGPQETTA